jgi:hypothetical protein
VSYRPWLGEQVLRQMSGLPAGGFDLLVQVLALICEDPYDRLVSRDLRSATQPGGWPSSAISGSWSSWSTMPPAWCAS